jgi:hypothetical protein
VVCDYADFRSRLWEERTRNVQLVFEPKGPRVWNRVMEYMWGMKPLFPWIVDNLFFDVIVLSEKCDAVMERNYLDWL